MQTLTEEIGNRIRVYRNRRKLTQADLAKRANCHISHIGNIERGRKVPTIETVYRICNALDLSLETLFKNITDGKTELEMPNKYYDFANTLPVKEQKGLFKLMEAIQAYHKNNR